MYIIDASYFEGYEDVPNVNELQGEASDVLERYIDDKVRLFLQERLNSVLYNDLDSNVTDGVLDEGAPQKWLNFVNGCDYTKDGKTYTWRGLIYANGLLKKSLLTNYVYCYWLAGNVSTVLGIGEAVTEAKNAISINSTQRWVTTWNAYVEAYQGKGCGSNIDFYFVNNVPIYDYFRGNSNSNYVNMVQFLTDNETDYPDTNLIVEDFKNQLGL
jgi:hypothetical protein